MTLKDKISNALVAGGLIGVLGGISDISYFVKKRDMLIASEAVNRIYTIEQELESITGKAMYESVRVRDHYSALVGEYDLLMSNPLVVQEKKEYESKRSRCNQIDAHLLEGAVITFVSFFILNGGMMIKGKPLFVPIGRGDMIADFSKPPRKSSDAKRT